MDARSILRNVNLAQDYGASAERLTEVTGLLVSMRGPAEWRRRSGEYVVLRGRDFVQRAMIRRPSVDAVVGVSPSVDQATGRRRSERVFGDGALAPPRVSALPVHARDVFHPGRQPRRRAIDTWRRSRPGVAPRPAPAARPTTATVAVGGPGRSTCSARRRRRRGFATPACRGARASRCKRDLDEAYGDIRAILTDPTRLVRAVASGKAKGAVPAVARALEMAPCCSRRGASSCRW